MVYISYYNRLQDIKLKTDEAENIIDESLRNKYDKVIEAKNLIEKLANNDKISFKELDELKEENISNFDMDRKLTENIGLMNTIISDYKSIKENQEVDDLLDEIKIIDERLTSAKAFYNKYITESNALALKFPSNIIAKIHGIKVKNFFDNKDLNDEEVNDFKL